ncbi:MAG: glyoxalase [Candidatus Methylomirabilota bacterium]|nr:VOC family protein [Candidatus Methylomirabilis sp.]NJD68775.1 VOC family protein [candidate division NC10 bacterium]PWB47910.1 MAG: glyoxalase [candidate division NC10 bacterium]
MAAKPIPDGFHTVTPCLNVQGADKLIDFMKQAFDAVEVFRMVRPDGMIGHAEVKIGDSIMMLGEASGECPPMPGTSYLYVNDADVTYKRALQAGATSLMEPTDMFWGDRHACVKDRCGNHWGIATHKEDVSPEELSRRAETFWKQQPRG